MQNHCALVLYCHLLRCKTFLEISDWFFCKECFIICFSFSSKRWQWGPWALMWKKLTCWRFLKITTEKPRAKSPSKILMKLVCTKVVFITSSCWEIRKFLLVFKEKILWLILWESVLTFDDFNKELLCFFSDLLILCH